MPRARLRGRAATVRAGAVSTAESADNALANASTDCQRWAVNQSGYDPATISQWTTQVMVDSYNRALDSCMNSRGYRAN